MDIREHRGFAHGLRPGQTRDLNCASCANEDTLGVPPNIRRSSNGHSATRDAILIAAERYGGDPAERLRALLADVADCLGAATLRVGESHPWRNAHGRLVVDLARTLQERAVDRGEVEPW
jgi:hypothetical protein